MTSEQWRAFQRNGYVHLGDLGWRKRLKRIVAKHGFEFRKAADKRLRYLTEDRLVKAVCRRVYGETEISVVRSIFMNKPANQEQNSELGWHQDCWPRKYRYQPRVTFWCAIDPATNESGCMWVLPRSHETLTIFNAKDRGGALSSGQSLLVSSLPNDCLLANPGDVYLFNNYLLHRSGHNATNHCRRAMSITLAPTWYLS